MKCHRIPLFLIPRLTLTIILILLASILVSCSLIDEFIQQEESIRSINVIDDSPTENTITFNVKIPDNTPKGEPILISIMDEVTGLSLNTEHHKMNKKSGGIYSIDLDFTSSSIIKYRYSRQGAITAEEHTSDGRSVRYRLFKVEAPAEVNDVVSRWNDTEFEGETGRINGTIIDEENEMPVPGLLITAGGAQTMTDGGGNFLIEGLPPGTHTIVAYSLDGAYLTYQHAALVKEGSSTPATILVKQTKKTDISFIIQVPESTPPGVPIRLAGNLYQLGNTFADLAGGMSSIATRMPELTPLENGIYGIILSLPAGIEVKYKYTLGDGFWNSERGDNGDWIIRTLNVPEEPIIIEDTVTTWTGGKADPITFDVTIPENTPVDDDIFIQFNPYGWTEPIPMWHLEGQRWAYILYSPMNLVENLTYRYCKSGQCFDQDNTQADVENWNGQTIQINGHPQEIVDQIDSWDWFQTEYETSIDLNQFDMNQVESRKFISGVEFQYNYHPSYLPLLPRTADDLNNLGAGWVFLTPGWTFTRLEPPVLDQIQGQDMSWFETSQIVETLRNHSLNVALRPIAHTRIQVDTWWNEAERDFSWWVSWFDQFNSFAVHNAKLTATNDIPYLILGGEWMNPALPSGILTNGDPSGVPDDAEGRYSEIISEVRNYYDGNICWALSYPENVVDPPGFIDDVDCVYILWDEKLSDEKDASRKAMLREADRMISRDIYSLWLTQVSNHEKFKVFLNFSYPSVSGALTGCLPDPVNECISPGSLNYPAPNYPLLDVDFDTQALAYDILMEIVSKYDWISGVISGGYYPPTVLGDKSTSIHGKPAEEVLASWFNILNNSN